MQQAQLIGQSLKTISPVVSTLDRIGTQTLNMMAALARKMDLRQVIEGTLEPAADAFTTTGSDFEHQNFDVTFEIVDPAENDRRVMVGQGLRRQGDISRRTFFEKYLKETVEDADEEQTRLLEEAVIQGLVDSGMLMQVALEQGVANQLTAGLKQGAGGDGTQTRQTNTIPVEARTQATELEQLSGQTGSLNIPKEVAEFGMSGAIDGLPTIPAP